MPVKVRARRKGEKGKPFKIVSAATGKIEAESDSRRAAEQAASIRNRASREAKSVR